MPASKQATISISHHDINNIDSQLIKNAIATLLSVNLIHERLDGFYGLFLLCQQEIEQLEQGAHQKKLLAELSERGIKIVAAILGCTGMDTIKEKMALRQQCREHTPNFMPWKKPEFKDEALLFVPEEEVVVDKADNVDYLDTPEQREPYRILLSGDGLLCKLSFSRSPQGGIYELTPFDTSQCKAHGKPGSALIVVTPDGDIYAGSTKECGFYHASFMAAQRLYFAGKFGVQHGKILSIDNRSGHYRTPPGILQNIINFIGEAYFLPNRSTATAIRFEYTPETNTDRFIKSDFTLDTASLAMKLSHYDVVISGMGPAGLATAIELVGLGYSVLLIDKRKLDYLRPQVVYLTKGSKRYLQSLWMEQNDGLSVTDDPFLEHIKHSWGVGIKDVERFLFAQLEKRAAKAGAKVEYLTRHRISSVAFDDGVLMVEPDYNPDFIWKEYAFDTLIGADGGRHHLANLLRTDGQINIEYATESRPNNRIFSPRNWHNASLYAELRRKDRQPFTFPFIQFITLPGDKTTEDEAPFAYCLYYLMFAHNYTNQQVSSAKFNAAMEIPEAMYDELKSFGVNKAGAVSKVLDYIKKGLSERLASAGYNPDEFEVVCTQPSKKHGPRKDGVKFGLFDTKIACASQAYAQSPSGKLLLVIGDAYRKPFFHISHGLNDALWQASLLRKVMGKPQALGLDAFDALLRSRSTKVSEMTETLGNGVTCFADRWAETKVIETSTLGMFNRFEPEPEVSTHQPKIC